MDKIIKIMQEKIQDLIDLKLLEESDQVELFNDKIILVDLEETRTSNKKDIPNGEILYPVLINGNPEYELRVKENPDSIGDFMFLSMMRTTNVVEKKMYLEKSREMGREADARLFEVPFLGTSYFVEAKADNLEFYISNNIRFIGNTMNKGIPLDLNSLDNLIQRFSR